MPISTSTTFSSVPYKTASIGLSSVPVFNVETRKVALQIPNFIDTSSISFQDLDVRVDTAVLNTVSAAETASTPLVARSFFSTTVLGFTTSPAKIGPFFHPLSLQVGSPPISQNPFKVTTSLLSVPARCLYLLNGSRMTQGFRTVSPIKNEYTSFVTVASGITTSGSLLLIDLLGPQLFNLVPASGGSYVDPSTDISFDLIDTGGATIVPGTVDIYINGIQVIDAGADVTPGGFGSTVFTQISDSFYQFLFTSASGYDLGEYVNVSGIAADDITPSANTTIFSYNFHVWGAEPLYASISGSADVDAPFLDNLDPLPAQVEVAVDADIILDIVDLHTGVNPSSVLIHIDDRLAVSGNTNVNPDELILSVSGYDSNRSYTYEIDFLSNLNFSDTVSVNVVAEDLYNPPNTFSGSYSFTTQANAHLVASGLQIEEDFTFIGMSVGESYVTTSSTPFTIKYVNLQDLPIDTVASNVQLNGSVIPSLFTSVTGSLAHYEVSFELEPDYLSDSTLTFHVQQSGTVSGNLVFSQYTTELLWGYEVCYDAAGTLLRESDFQSVVQICDSADSATLSAEVLEFSTEPFLRESLGASIVGISSPSNSVLATVESNNTFFEYGKIMNFTLEAEDFAGNQLIFNWSFTIEDK
jgi:hypothetical protein